MTHPFFDDLKVRDAKMASGKEMPPLFDFTREGSFSILFLLPILIEPSSLELSIRPDLIRSLVPPQTEPELLSRGIDINNFVPIPLADMRISLD